MSDHVRANTASRDRLRGVAGALRASGGTGPAPDGGWSATVILAHVAFWDRMGLARWRHADALGETFPPPVPPGMSDLINDASRDQWSALSIGEAVALAETAAEELDAYLEALADERVAAARTAGFDRLVDRSLHRDEHLDSLSPPP